ncbi:MoaD/ThiS family protein [Thermodesulfobacteriota bacterium]
MPRFRIRLMDPLTVHIGKTKLDVQAEEEATLYDVVTEVGRKYGEIVKKKIVGPDGDLHPYVLVSVNGTDIRQLDGIYTRLHDGDKMLVALLIVGG